MFRITISTLFCIALTFLWQTAQAAPPELPHLLHGTVTVDEQLVADGEVLIATVTEDCGEGVCASAEFTATIYTSQSSAGSYTVRLDSDDETTDDYEGGTNGDTITFRMADGTLFPTTISFLSGGFERLDLVTITNTPPEAVNDTVTLPEDTINYALDVLSNDSDVDGHGLTVTNVGTVPNGSAIISGTTILLTPSADFSGRIQFDYTITDEHGSTNTATVTANVTPVNDPPRASFDQFQVAEDSVLRVSADGVLENDIDIDSALRAITVLPAQHGALVLALDGGFVYTPTQNFNGFDTFFYVATDAEDASFAPVLIEVLPVNDAPTAQSFTQMTFENGSITFDVLSRAKDVDGDALSVILGTITNGSATVSADNRIQFTPAIDFIGQATIAYRVTDGIAQSRLQTIAIDVQAPTDVPLSNDDAAQTIVDNDVEIDPIANDVDFNGDDLFLEITQTEHGFAEVFEIRRRSSTTQRIRFEPAEGFSGTATIKYVTNDGVNQSQEATIFIEVAAVNTSPTAMDDAVEMAEDTTVTIDVLDNDNDADSARLSIEAVATPAVGTVENRFSELHYTPPTDFHGTVVFTYTVTDNEFSDTGSVTVTVNSVNDAPITVPDAAETDEDTPIMVAVVANDSDIDGDALTVRVASSPQGTVSIVENAVQFTPNVNFHGVATVNYTIGDGSVETNGIATITVLPVNDPPVASADNATAFEDRAVTIDALDNDSDVDQDGLTLTILDTQNGSAVVTDGKVVFTPATNFNGTATVSYQVSDGSADSDPATITIQVIPVSDTPISNDDHATIQEDSVAVIDVLDNDLDNDGGVLSAEVVDVTNGLASVNGAGQLVYTPTANFNGITTLTYYATDGQNNSANATVTITVAAVNDAPTTLPDSATTTEDTPVILDVLDNDSDIEGDALINLTIVGATIGGVATVEADQTVRFVPSADFNGIAQFTYSVQDRLGATSDTTATVTVAAINDTPIALDDIIMMNEDTTVARVLVDNDIDVDGDALTVLSISDPTHGTLSLVDTMLTYTPMTDFFGVELLTYIVSDGTITDTANVRIVVSNVNDAPIAVDDTYTGPQDTPITVNFSAGLLQNDSDVDGDTLTVDVLGEVVGELTLQADGGFEFVPSADFVGTTEVTYILSDGSITTTGTISFAVTAIETGVSQTIIADEGGTLTANEQITLNVPADAFSENVVIVLRDLPDVGRNIVQLGNLFTIEVYINGMQQTEANFLQAIQLVYDYSHLSPSNGQVELARRVNDAWQTPGQCDTASIRHDISFETLTTTLCQAGVYVFQVDTSVPTAVLIRGVGINPVSFSWVMVSMILLVGFSCAAYFRSCLKT